MKTKNVAYKILIALVLVTAFAYRVFADNVGCQMHNQSTSRVTFSVDGNYGCTAEEGDTCSFTTTSGTHTFKAVRTDNNKSIAMTEDVGTNGCAWTVTDSSDWQ
jgi:hypothetical protein